MRKNYFLLILFTCVGHILIAQDENKFEPFRRDYHYIRYTEDGEERHIPTFNTYIFNFNENFDVRVIQADGEDCIYRKFSDIEEGEFDGITYQYMRMLDNDGDELGLYLFETGELVLVYGTGENIHTITFTNKEPHEYDS